MIRGPDFAQGLTALASLLTASVVAAPSSPPALTGEVRSLQAQPIYTPPTGWAPIVLRYYVPDGTEVVAGQVLVRADPRESASRLRSLGSDIAKAEATAGKEIAELEIKVVDAELALVDAEANLQKARIDAALPRELISALDFDRYQGELERTEREFVLKGRELDDARAAVAHRRHDAELETRRMRLEQTFYQTQLAAAEVRAERAGVVLHGIDPRGLRFEEGSTSFAGLLVGEVVSAGNMAVRAYALETERSHVAVGTEVTIDFDALPGTTVVGKIDAISGAPEPRPVWGDGRYFTIDILLNEGAGKLVLIPGMSARVHPLPVGTSVAARGP
jgi:HlyD family secretion protein